MLGIYSRICLIRKTGKNSIITAGTRFFNPTLVPWSVSAPQDIKFICHFVQATLATLFSKISI